MMNTKMSKNMKPMKIAAILIFIAALLSASSFALVANRPTAQDINDISATIIWTTDVAASSLVGYGTSLDVNQEQPSAMLVTYHSMTLTGLQPKTKYYYYIASRAGTALAQNTNNNRLFTFTTTSTPDAVKPKISNITEVLSSASATISWMTDKDATTVLYYGVVPLMDLSAIQTNLTKSHSITIPTEPRKTYRYIASSCDSAGNCMNSSAQGFSAGITNNFLTASVPEFSDTNRITISGSTKPFATVSVYINNELKLKKDADESGFFEFARATLYTESNNVTVIAVDQAGQNISQSYVVLIDDAPPEASLEKISDSNAVSQQKLTVKGNTNEPGRVLYSVKKEINVVPPSRVVALEARETASITLNWQPNTETDFLEYGIYRDNVRIATTKATNYTDVGVYKSKTYSYRVSAVDTSCNEGPLSDIFTIKTKSGQNEPTESYRASANATPISFSCAAVFKTIDVPAAGAFTFDVELEQGTNRLTVLVQDRAGNQVDLSRTVILDTIPPQITSNNLRDIKTSYSPEVSITGKVSEQAAVTVWLNNKVDKVVKTDSEGNFKVGITLKKDPGFRINKTPTSVEAEIGDAWDNRIKLVATDIAGLQSQAVEDKVTYAICGYGSWFNIDLRGPLPNTLNPRMMLEGIQQLGFSANISYRGGYKATIRSINVRPMTVSPAFEADYDHNWIESVTKNFARPKNEVGYIALKFRPLENDIPGDTYYKKEDNLSSNRGGYFKALLLVEVDAQEEIPVANIDPNTQKTLANFTLRNIKQKQCVDVKVQIDKRIDPSIIHKGFLKKNIERLDRLVKNIDNVLEPTKKIGTYAMTSCFVSNGLMWLTYFMEKTSCDLATLKEGPLELLKNTLTGGKKNIRTLAEAGLCEKAFSKIEGEHAKDNDDAREACNSCKSAIENRKSIESIRDSTCDRIACPSVPTLQNYITQAQKKKPVEIAKIGTTTYYSGSSCAFKDEVGTDYPGIKKVYADYKAQKNNAAAILAGTSAAPTTEKVDCSGLHPAKAECCGQEYMDTWGSGCDIPFADDVTFDEIKESTCLAGQTAGAEATKSLKDVDPNIDCSPNLFNAVSGFCEPNTGQPKGSFEPLRGVYYSQANSFPASREKSGSKAAVYVAIIPESDDEISALRGIIGAEAPVQNYKIVRGQVVEKLKLDEESNAPEVKKLLEGRTGLVQKIKPSATIEDYDIPVQIGTSFVPDKDTNADATSCFDPEQYKGPDDKSRNAAQLGCFKTKICDATVIANDRENTDACIMNAKELFDKIKSKITTNTKAYIVDPAEGLFNSVKCVCIPAVQGQLEKWKSITILLKTCLESIYYTGDGSAGACQALISQYACDMLWDGITCFTQKYSLGAGKRVDESPGIGDVIGAFTGAGTSVYQSNLQRYGSTPTWQTMFTERKLANAVCLWAFTGTWDIDMSTLYQDSVRNFPIDSTGAVLRGERRFVAFNPTTRPRGLATWSYRLGFMLAAGADLTYKLELKCSNSFDCDPRAGFKDGKCDCYGKTEQKLLVGNVYGRAKKGDVLGSGPEGEQFITVQAGDAGSNIRYDTAVLSWEWLDPKTNSVKKGEATKKIGLAGSEAPIFCSFDTFAFAYRCEFGIGEYAGAKFGDIAPKFTEGGMFRKTDQLKFDVPITKQTSTDTRETYSSTTYNKETKYLVYEVKNQNGITIATNANEVNPNPINEVESFTQAITITSPSSISDAQFTATQASTSATITDLWYLQAGEWYSGKEFVIGEELPEKDSYIAVVDKDGNYAVYFGTRQVSDNATDYYKKGAMRVEGLNASVLGRGKITSGNKIEYSGERNSFAITLKSPRPDYLELYVMQKSATIVSGCDPTKPVTWTATFTMYDAINDYPHTINRDQITQDAASGDPQTKTVQFSAICNDVVPATAAGNVSTFIKCSNDPTIANTYPCYCGDKTDTEASKLESTEKFNCGTGTGDKTYCSYSVANQIVSKQCIQQKLTLAGPATIEITDASGETVEADSLRSNTKYTFKVKDDANNQYFKNVWVYAPTALGAQLNLANEELSVQFAKTGTAEMRIFGSSTNGVLLSIKTQIITVS
jgi:hypothetical protein